MSSDALSKIVNLLSFVALGLTILLIVQARLERQVRVFGLQSFVLALLSTLIAPPSSSLKRRLSTRPNPVPPYLRVVVASA